MGRKQVKKNRPKMETKEELLSYLEANQDKEFPFCEEIYNIAVEKTDGKERAFKEIVRTEYDGTTKTKRIPNGSVNPVSKYFQLIALPHYNKKVQAMLCFREEDEKYEEIDEDIDDIIELTEDDEANSFVRELASIYFSKVLDDETQFVIDRLSDYYTNYEFNEGSDKFLVISAVSDELTLRELYSKRITSKGVDNEVRIDKVKRGYLSTLESLKALKKQSGKLDEGKNKFTIFLDELDKAGELNIKIPDIPNDQIGSLVNSFRQSIVRAFRDG